MEQRNERRLEKQYRSLEKLAPNKIHHPNKYANISGATIVASLSIIYFGVSIPNLPQVIFSFGTAPE